MLLMCFSAAPSVMERSEAMPAFVRPSAIAASTSRSRGVRSSRRSCATTPGHELCHDLGIEGGAAGGDAYEGIRELADVGHPVLEQIADAACSVRQELARVLRLDVLAEHQHGRSRDQPAGLDRRAQSLVALRGRHAHVDDGDVGPMADDRGHERWPVADGSHDRRIAILDEPHEAFAQEDRILRDHHPHAVLLPWPDDAPLPPAPSVVRPGPPWVPSRGGAIPTPRSRVNPPSERRLAGLDGEIARRSVAAIDDQPPYHPQDGRQERET